MKRQGLLVSTLLLLAFIAETSFCAAAVPGNMSLVAENDDLALYINRSTTEIAVVQKASGNVWYSNPQDWSKLETHARGTAKEQLGAQLLIAYDESERRNREMNNYTDSTAHGLFEIVEIENGVRVEYTLGRRWQDADWLPVVISKERLEREILPSVPEKDRGEFANRYHLVYLRKPSGVAPLQLQGMNMDTLLKGYEFVVVDDKADALTEQILGLKEQLANAKDSEREDIQAQISRLETQLNGIKANVAWEILEVIYDNRSDLERMTDVEFKHIEQLIDTPTYYMGRVPVFARTNLIKSVKATDYTPEDASDDRVANNLDPLQPNLKTFFVPMEYRLDVDSLVVEVPMGEVVYPLEVQDNQGETYTYPLHTITVLPYFSAAHRDTDGYIFVPDGSGALVRFGSAKYTLSYLGPQVYGLDLTEDNKTQRLVQSEQTYMPVYGLKSGDTAFVAIIEDGEALARINTARAGFVNSYNYVNPQFKVMPHADLSLGPIGSVVVYQKRIYQGDIRIRFRFLSGDDADYVGMAKAYRDYLIGMGRLTPLDSEGDLPFYLSVVGSIPRDEPVLGIPRRVIRSLTTFDQTQEIADKLLTLGVRNIKLRYSGWLRGGPEHIFPDRVSLEPVVGGRKGLDSLAATLEEKGVAFYPQVSFLNVFRNSVFDGFLTRRDAAQFFDNRPKEITDYDLVFGLPTRSGSYILSPKSLGRVVESFFDDYSKYHIDSIGLDCLGDQVNSDFRNKPEAVVDRQQSARIVEEQLAWIQRAGYGILVEGGNALSYPYVEGIVGVPFRSSDHEILDESVPFYQLVVSGQIEYAGIPLNMSSDYRRLLLQSVSLGAGLHFQWAYGNTALLTNTDYDHLFAIRYEDWLEQAVSDYHKANEVHSVISGARIVDYHQSTGDHSVTVYDNGVSIETDFAASTLTVHCPSGEAKVYQF